MRVPRVIRVLALTIGLSAYAHDGLAVFICPEGATDERSVVRLEAWRQYFESVHEALRDSPDPRDQALAAFADSFALDERVQAEAVARSAADAAADDMLVQWVALRRSQVASGNYEPMLSRLEQHEPDNAAVWLEVLVRAVYLKDRATADDALARMAQSSRFDAGLTDLSNALSQAFARFPGDPGSSFEDEATGLVAGVRPVFEPLLAMCRIDPDTGANLDRASACASIGRLLVAGGSSTGTSEAGHVLLGDSQPAL
jgi:hypothetical protein